MPLQLRRGVEADRTTIVPANGELIYTTDSKLVYVGDGSTVGGVAVTGGSGISFTTIAVAGQGSVVADNSSDTLNLVAGFGISITTVPGTDSISIINTRGALVTDPAPQLGQHLDLNGFEIRSTRSNEDIVINPSGTGKVVLTGDLDCSAIRPSGALNITANGLITFGSNSALIDADIYIVRNSYSNSPSAGFSFVQHHDTADAVNMNFYRTRGTNSAPSAVINGDDIMDFNFTARTGSIISGAAAINVIVDGNPTASHVPARIAFATNNGSGRANRVQITAAGVLETNQLGALTGTDISMPTNNSLTVGSVRLSQAGLSTTSSNENLVLDASGTGKVISTSSFEVSGTIGYATGTGGTITQSTNKTTGVTLDKACGTITTASGSINSGDEFSFTVTNSFVDDTDVVLVNIKSGGTAGAYLAQCDQVSNGSFRITVTNISNITLDEILALNFIIVKSVSA